MVFLKVLNDSLELLEYQAQDGRESQLEIPSKAPIALEIEGPSYDKQSIIQQERL